jgi:transposase
MKAYSQDLRQKVIEAVERTNNKSEVARTFGIGLATVKRFVSLKAKTGQLKAKKSSGRTKSVSPQQYPQLIDQLSQYPDATLAEHCELWAASHGTQLSLATMSRTIVRLGWTRKKRQWQPVNVMNRLAASSELNKLV